MPIWSPYMKQVWNKNQLSEWVNAFGDCAMYDGKMWELNKKSITRGIYRVWFTEKTA